MKSGMHGVGTKYKGEEQEWPEPTSSAAALLAMLRV